MKDPEYHKKILIIIKYRSNNKINPPGTAKVPSLIKFFIVEKPRRGADLVKIVLKLSKTGRSSVAGSQYQI